VSQSFEQQRDLNPERMGMNRLTEITEVMFDETVITSDQPFFVDFFAPWCVPCKGMVPALEDLADEYEGELRFLKVDIDSAAALAKRYRVVSVPTFLIVKRGEVVGRLSGTQTRSKLASLIEDSLV